MGQLGKSISYKEISYNKAFFIARTLEYISTIFLGGREPLLTRYTVSVLSQSQTLSLEKAQQELGYVPAVSIEKGTMEFVEWWKKHEN
jgi:nucleoside-diphosphate-sugar epimerase